ncbi:zinc finger, CCHC-type containing protein [Tanacetum coccineum]
MAVAAMKHMASNFSKLDKFEGVDFRRWQKKMHFLCSNMSVVYVLTTPISDDGGDATMEQLRNRAKWDNDDYVCRGLILKVEDASSKKFLVGNFTNYKMTDSRPVSCIIDKLHPSWKHTLKHKKEELTLVELGSHLRIEESLKVQDNDKPKATMLLVHSSILNNCGHNQVIESNKFILSKHGVFIGFGYLSNQVFRLNIVNDNIASAFMSTSKLNDSILWHARLGHVHFKRMQDMSKDGLIPAFDMDTENDLCDLHATPLLGNKKYFVTFIDDALRFYYVYLLNTKDEALDKFKVFKTKVKLQQGSLIKRFRTDRGGLSQGLWGEAMLTMVVRIPILILGSYDFTILQNKNDPDPMVPNKRNKIAPYELWTNKKPNLNYLRVWGYRAVVRLPDPKLKTLGERGIECIFVGYVEHSKAFRFFVIEHNESVLINSIIESRDAIVEENRFSSVLRPSLRILNGTEDVGGSVVPEEVTEEVVQQSKPKLIKSKRNRTLNNLGPGFQLYLIEGTRDEVSDQHSYCFNVEDDPKTFDEAIKSQNVAFWKEAINDKMDSIMGNNTWVLDD